MLLPTLEGSLINLRRINRSDAASIQHHANDPLVAQYLPFMPHPYSLRDARLWINTTHRLARTDIGYHFGIEDRASREIVGCIGLKNVNRHDLNAELGYWVSRAFWRNGFATEAVRLMQGFVFGQLKLRRLYAIVLEANTGSVKLLEKTGFVREGTWRKASLHKKRWYNVYSYGLLKEEFSRHS